jgi:type VI secretion system protein ImpH
MALDEYSSFLPGQGALARLRALVRTYVGDELAWELQLVLRPDEVPAAALGATGGALGWSCWLGERGAELAADDLCLQGASFPTRP